MSRTAEVLAAILPAGTDIPAKLNITDKMWARVQLDDKHVRPWLMRYLINRYRVNPLYIYHHSSEMLLPD